MTDKFHLMTEKFHFMTEPTSEVSDRVSLLPCWLLRENRVHKEFPWSKVQRVGVRQVVRFRR